MPSSRLGTLLFVLGAGLTAGILVLGKFFLPEGPQPGLLAGGSQLLRNPKFILFAFGFPLGIGLAVWGAALWGEVERSRAWRFAIAAGAGPLVMLAMPGLFGPHNSPTYFGIGGVTLWLLILLTIALWGRYRTRLPATARTTTDLQGLGYLCFALAGWTICGVGGMPGFALYPDRMQQLDSQFLAIVNLKSVMAFLLLGWLFTLLACYRAYYSNPPSS